MTTIRSKFSNLAEILEEMTSEYKGGFKSDDGYCMSFIMPIFTFGHHTGDNYFELVRGSSGFVFSIVSRHGSKEVLKTSSQELLEEDMSYEEWGKFIDDILRRHIVKPEYPTFAAGEVGRDFKRRSTGKGCLVSILLVVFVILISSFIS